MTEAPLPHAPIGVIVVTYGAADFIADCLESLVATGYPDLRIVVVDNASPDGTAEAVQAWASGAVPFVRPPDWPDDWTPDRDPDADGGPAAKPLALARHGPEAQGDPAPAPLTLIETGANLGFAGGVNVGLAALRQVPEIDHFWVLNPDTIVPPETPFRLAAHARTMGRYGLIGGRILFRETPERIQLDGGRLHRMAGTAVAVHLGQDAAATALPDPAGLDFVSGAHMMASREFLDRAGLMEERYFLYYEEMDWQLRRGDLPLGLAPGAEVRHAAGASIGSGGRSLKPSPFALYFGSRNLLGFVARWAPLRLPLAYLLAWVRLVRHWDGTVGQIAAMVRGLHRLGPPKAVRARLPETVWARILGR